MTVSDPLRTGSARRTDVIDGEHLTRMTLGDRGLERELLEIFVRQSATILDRITGHVPDRAVTSAAAHTMIGSARGIGAWRVARAAEEIECAVQEGNQTALDKAIAALKSASLEVNAAIAARLSDPSHRLTDCA